METLMATKRCARCGEEKPRDQFHAQRKARDGLAGYCKPCSTAAHSEWVAANVGQVKNYARRHWLKQYGITWEQYVDLLASQDGRCAICREAETGDRRGGLLHVDHDHASGKVRGLLCFSCNRAIGYLKDSPERLRAAAAYLDRSYG